MHKRNTDIRRKSFDVRSKLNSNESMKSYVLLK
jgi:hypothetical protein